MTLKCDNSEVASSKRKRPKKDEPRASPYDDSQEGLPELPAYHASFQEAEKLVPGICDIPLIKITELKTSSGFQDEKLDTLAARLLELRNPCSKYPKPKRVGFLGDTAAGKSSLINCLLGQEVTAECDDGTSGTHVIQEFLKAPPSQVCKYSATLYFHDPKKVEKLVERYHKDIQEDLTTEKEELSHDEVAEIEVQRDTAIEFFTTLLCDLPDFKSEEITAAFFQQARNRDKTKTVRELTELVLNYQSGLGCKNLEKIFASDSLQDVVGPLRKHCRPARATKEGSQSSPWPLISRAQVRLRCTLLDAGVMLADLPGVTDRNRIRVESTKEYLKSCSAIVIAHLIVRITTAATVQTNLRECQRRGKLKDTIIVATKIDDIKPPRQTGDDEADLSDWSEDVAKHYRDLEEDVYRLERKIEETEDDEDDAKDPKELKAQVEELGFALNLAKCRLSQTQIEVRNHTVTIELTKECRKTIKEDHAPTPPICFVSNTNYQDHLQGYRRKSPPKLDVKASGIPRLRQMLLEIPAAEKMAALETLCREDLPLALNALELRCGKTTLERKEDVEFLVTKPRVRCATAITQARDGLNEHFQRLIVRFISEHETAWLKEAEKLSSDWKRYKTPTFNAVCRHNGKWIRKGRNTDNVPFDWNEELIEIYEEGLITKFPEFLGAVDSMENYLSELLIDLLTTLTTELKDSPLLVGLELAPFFNSLAIRQGNVAEHTSRTLKLLRADIRAIQCDFTNPESGGYIRSIMDKTYDECRAVPKGNKRITDKRKSIISEKLESKIFTECGRNAEAAFRQALDHWVGVAQEELLRQCVSLKTS